MIKTETVFKTQDDGSQIALHKWVPYAILKKNIVRYVVHISHGMAEHAQRYDHFARFLCENGIAVYAHDHRGHGKTASTATELGFLAHTNGFQRVVLDLRSMIETCHSDFPGVPVILLGHSFGSFIAQSFIEQFGDEIEACILSGTAGPRIPLSMVGSALAAIVKKFKGAQYRSKFLDNLSFGTYRDKIAKPCAEFAWLSSNSEVVQKYEDDSLCGFLCTTGFFYDLTSGLTRIHKAKNIRRIPKNLPVLFFAGTADPVGSYTESIKKLALKYRKSDMLDITERYYKDGRHEMLNELSKDEVYKDVLEWINNI